MFGGENYDIEWNGKRTFANNGRTREEKKYCSF